MVFHKICKLCGDEFTTEFAKQIYCNKDKEAVCPICGDTYIVKCRANYAHSTCDKPECRNRASCVGAAKKVKICKLCGREFTNLGSTRQIYCNLPRTKNCVICGKEMELACGVPYLTTNCCSDKCKHDFTYQQRDKKALAEVKVCKLCGKEFRSRSKKSVYCNGPHYRNCVICGKEFEIKIVDGGPVETLTCSKKCKYIYASQQHDYQKGIETYKKVLMNKYGVDNAAAIPGVQEKAKETCKLKYGSEWYTQTDEYKEQVKKTNLEKYGVEYPTQSKEVRDKINQVVREKYGVDNVFQSEEIKERTKQTNLEKYGFEYASQSPEVIEKVKQNNIEKYGVVHPMMLPEYQAKAVQTSIEKYGRRAFNQKHIPDIEKWYSFIDDPKGYIERNYTEPPTSKKLAKDLEVDISTIDVYLSRFDSYSSVKTNYSTMEEEVKDFLLSIDPNLKIESRRHNQITPYELDLFMPDIQFAIECNPTCTHNSSLPDPWGADPKTHGYHKMKTDMCEAKGIFLFHLFGHEWNYKNSIIKSMLRNIIKKNENVIYARKCKVIDVSSPESFEFLESNHRQGSANSPIRLGLEYEGKLVSLMTFGKMRGTIGTGKEDLSNCYELVRFCNLLNTSVVGAASKLFSHFVRKYNPERVRSFSDRARAKGTLYSTLGFSEVRRSDPGYVWVDIETDEGFNRVNAQKHNIKKFLRDDSIDLSKSEREIMIEHGFVQVFDCGTILWEWNKGDLK